MKTQSLQRLLDSRFSENDRKNDKHIMVQEPLRTLQIFFISFFVSVVCMLN